MCGIFCAINNDGNECQLHDRLAKLLQNRGPNAQSKLMVNNVLLAGNVLWQQGASPQKQPISDGNIELLFNGDLYNVNQQKPIAMADSAWLAKEIAKCNNDAELLALFKELEGPYCLVFYNKQNKLLYFGRDALGRNSLIIERSKKGGGMQLTSTSYYLEEQEMTALELPPLGLYKMHVNDLSECVLFPWQTLAEHTTQQLRTIETALNWTIRVENEIAPKWLASKLEAPTYDFYAMCSATQSDSQTFEDLLNIPAVNQIIGKLDKLLRCSISARVKNTPSICRACLDQQQQQQRCNHAKLCILYSGGIDCSIIALLAHELVPIDEPIELINVAFERVSSNGTEDWNVPDRQTAKQSYAELQRLCPARCWQLLNVNVSREQLHQQLSTHIKQLIYPLQTVLDESIGCAFWFAATAADSTARVALLGSGADELFGGYIRHRNAYLRAADEKLRHQAVLAELEFDWRRIPSRNLARDDRVIADSGKTARAPFIEEHLVNFIRSLQPQQRCCFVLPDGVGDKLLLRVYGYKLGLRDAVLLKKRAIQFGSRIADKKQHAAHQSQYLRFDHNKQ